MYLSLFMQCLLVYQLTLQYTKVLQYFLYSFNFFQEYIVL